MPVTRRNPPLVIFGNPKREPLSESEYLAHLNRLINDLYVAGVGGDRDSAEMYRATAAAIIDTLRKQVGRGVHTNPRRTKVAQNVQAVVYINAKDNKPYAHGFGNADLNERALLSGKLLMSDLKERTDVCAYGNADGTITLEGKRGQRLWKLFPLEDGA